ncbi:hypothetical protein ACLI07_23160 (plasmid) [Providencia huaxiensis]|uniref:Lipoprotein n=7 Tax=Enterobacterales TaxID=91347 RepID=A0A7L8KA96_ECOLX|nr:MULTISPECIES: hypothetical protein [Enterobacterales]ELB1214863.1 hypothetical protein [Proteus mirabilis]ELY4881505.1 hypothetical protein [Morganella morganii]SPY66562.1 Uncharacterised protein [Providencia stuartii]ELR5094304.1 hypothetical protein [Providencia rettgeri]ELR5243153.1 hypothetical protein [Providencia rettgeri]
MKNCHRLKLSIVTIVAAGVFLSGCSDSKEKERQQYEYVNYTQIIPPKMYIPGGYTYTETWHGTIRGGAALTPPAYEHALVSPYAIYDPTGKRYGDERDKYTDLLLTSVANSAYAKGPRGTFTQTPSFCGENSRMLSGASQKATRSEYLQIKQRYCSTPGYRLTQHEIDVLNGGEPQELRDYRINMYIDNQLPK